MKKMLLAALMLTATIGAQADEGMWMICNLSAKTDSVLKSMGLELTHDQIYSKDHPSLNDAIVQFVDRLKGFRTEYPGNPEGLKKAVEDEFVSFVTAHKNDPCATYAILLAKNRIEPKMILKLIDSASPKIQKDGDVDAMKKILSMAK